MANTRLIASHMTTRYDTCSYLACAQVVNIVYRIANETKKTETTSSPWLWGSADFKMPIYAHFFGGRFWPIK